METSTFPSYDPYIILPFTGYPSVAHPGGESCHSLMHFIESEKFRGVDESFRQFLLNLADPDDFLLETGAIHHERVRADWAEVRFSLIRAGMWMQLVQHQDTLRESLLKAGCQTGIPLLDDVAGDIYQRLMSAHEEGNELRRVIIVGDLTIQSDAVFEKLDHLFQHRLPDELFVSTESGIAALAHRYAVSRYIPVRSFDVAHGAQSCARALLEKGTHVFSLSVNESSDSELANTLLPLAIEQGKIAHRLAWGG